MSPPENPAPPSAPAPDGAGPAPENAPDRFLGQRVGNCWVVARLGEGGFGTVYRAIDEGTKRPVAIKLVKPEKAANEEAVRKFLRGAIAAAQVEHKNVVRIFRIGRDEKYRLHYIVMEHLQGRTLQVVLEERGALPYEEVLPWLLQAAEGLHASHEKGVIHRDVKPDNIMVSKEGIVKITDLGLARMVNRAMQTTRVMGTPHFMAPEQFEGKGMDRRTDVYGFGITLYYLLSFQFPYSGKTSMEIVFSMLTNPPRSLLDHRPEIHPDLWAIIRQCIARVQAERYGTMAEVSAALRGFLEKHPG